MANWEDEITGRQIVGVEVHSTYHPLDGHSSPSGVTLYLDDGRCLSLDAVWCNDSTADLDIEFTPDDLSARAVTAGSGDTGSVSVSAESEASSLTPDDSGRAEDHQEGLRPPAEQEVERWWVGRNEPGGEGHWVDVPTRPPADVEQDDQSTETTEGTA